MGNGSLAAAFLIYSLLLFQVSSTTSLQNPHLVVQDVNSRKNASSVAVAGAAPALGRKLLKSSSSSSGGGCKTGNLIDDCWRCDPDWASNRGRLADCAFGFGKEAMGGKAAADNPYVVVDDGDDVNHPKPGTLRYGVIQPEATWIIFATDMTIKLKDELVVIHPFKTIDGRGVDVHIAGGPCLNVHATHNFILHGVSIHDCQVGGDERIGEAGYFQRSDGDGIQVYQSSDVWIDHCYFSNAVDGLVDVIQGSTAVTISNNLFTNHNKVMLLGQSDEGHDTNMKVTVAYNVFGEGLTQRMPRCRQGYFHVVNNYYPSGWNEYAIGGSSNPTIKSQGNVFVAPSNRDHWEVTSREDVPESEYKIWNWASEGDMMVGGAFFVPSGAENTSSVYAKASSVVAQAAKVVPDITRNAGPFKDLK
ncbi:unnamed protein product [Cuscuta campestris]|uniref:Pectate lyase n=1 Tax=Cuscuta campestris TaxID=132261 RepID=A0A484M7L1_9ASTE|nr:unnamed protein product [Cuscuta campestris]